MNFLSKAQPFSLYIFGTIYVICLLSQFRINVLEETIALLSVNFDIILPQHERFSEGMRGYSLLKAIVCLATLLTQEHLTMAEE